MIQSTTDINNLSIPNLLSQLPSNDEIEQELIRRLFTSFGEHYSDGNWIAYRWIKYAAEIIAQKIKEGDWIIIISTPPQHGKTTSFGKWLPVWYLHNHPEHNVVYSSYSDDKSKEIGGEARDLYREITEHKAIRASKIKRSESAAGKWKTKHGGAMYSMGVGGALTGRGYHLGIIDDPIKNDEEAQSKTRREKIKRWWDKVFFTRKQHGATTIIIQTRWHNDDLIGYIKTLKGRKIIEIKLNALAEENDPLGRKPGEALCPERFTRKDLELERDSTPNETWQSLYQQQPSPSEGSVFKNEWFNYWGKNNFEPIIIQVEDKLIEKQPVRLPNDFDLVLQSWDMSFKKTTDGSFVVGQVWGYKKPNFYLLDQHRKREGFSEAKRAVIAMTEKHPEADGILIEGKANGDAVESELKDDIPGIILIEPKGSKEARASAASVMFEGGNVYIPNPKENIFVNTFITELLQFPKGANDDQVDSATQAINRIKQMFRRHLTNISLPSMNKESSFAD